MFQGNDFGGNRNQCGIYLYFRQRIIGWKMSFPDKGFEAFTLECECIGAGHLAGVLKLTG